MDTIEYSVIVPVYNSADVLGRCIESILNQTIDKFELILIDDGSTDGSDKICDKYEKKDVRIRTLHKKNEGVSKARNVGLGMAKGKYIVFVDSDDYVENDYLEKFGKENYDLVITGVWFCHNDLSIIQAADMENRVYDLVNEKAIIDILKKWYSSQACAKRFKRNIINQNKIAFIENCSFGEDTIFVAKYLSNVKNVKIKKDVAYRYCIYDSPSLSKIEKEEKFERYNFILEKTYDIFGEKKDIKQFVLNKYWWITEQEIEKICEDKTKKSVEKAQDMICILEKPMAQKCLNNSATEHLKYVKRIIYKIHNKMIIIFWIKIKSVYVKIRKQN